MASPVGICNRALQLVGASRITALDEDSVNARACNAAYEVKRKALLERHPWSFAVKRAQLAASTTAPAFGPANAFPLPTDYLRLVEPDLSSNRYDLDWQIEGQSILTNDSSPLNIRYVADVTDANKMPATFQEALSHEIAIAIVEALTQSNTKKAALESSLKDIINEARRKNAFERPARIDPNDEWIEVRT